MRRVWIVDDAVPVQALSYVPSTLPREGILHLLENHGAAWQEQEVRELCDSLSGEEFELTVILSPDSLNALLQSGVEPPHVVIFDWEGPGFSAELNTDAIGRVLESSFSFVQVYTHLGVEAVEAHIQDLRVQFPDRMLPASAKQDVNAGNLGTIVAAAWDDTIAGEVADSVRASARASVERVLIDLCSVKRNALAALLETATGGLDALLMAKLRDEIGSQGVGPFDVLSGGGGHVGATSELRRFQSIFYYHFPADDLVRTGDIVVSDAGTYAMVFSPQCHLERFRKKTGGRLTLIDAEEVAPDGIAALTGSGVKLSKVGASAIASHGSAGHSVVVLPNVPKEPNGRHSLFDIAIRTHAWNSLRIEKRENGPLQYADVPSVTRLCTITDTWCAAIVSHVAGIMASAGVPDFPDFEKARIDQILSQE